MQFVALAEAEIDEKPHAGIITTNNY